MEAEEAPDQPDRYLDVHRRLRHFFATTLITNHPDPKDVQRALRHSTLSITLETTYVHFWPRRERRKGIVGEALKEAVSGRWDLG